MVITAAPLEDAQHLTPQYDHLHQEAEAQFSEVAWRQFRNKEAGGNADNTLMLQSGRTEDRGNVTKPSLLGVASDQCNVD
ncbi:unnamed protein product [Sphagnum jensenii]|uniref:Uncharacterized protein n=1 Tax=Sphagnum jensenii TaxID=128206 RepID=A0ABP0XCD4_9BRYO